MNNNIATIYIKTSEKNTFFSLFKNTLNFKNKKIFNKFKLLKIFSCGQFNFKGKKKKTPFACSVVSNKSALYLLNLNINYIHIIFKGINLYKKIILNTILKTTINKYKLQVLSITDITSFPYNGCRPKKIKKR